MNNIDKGLVAIFVSLLAIGIFIAYTIAPSEKVIYKDKETNSSWCKLPVKLGDSGTILHGTYSGMLGTVAGKITETPHCAYLVKLSNQTYISVNSNNFIGVKQ